MSKFHVARLVPNTSVFRKKFEWLHTPCKMARTFSLYTRETILHAAGNDVMFINGQALIGGNDIETVITGGARGGVVEVRRGTHFLLRMLIIRR